MKSTYSKVNKQNLKFVVLKRMMIFLLKMKEENEILEKAGNQVQEKTKLRSIILKPAELISLFYLKMSFLMIIVTSAISVLNKNTCKRRLNIFIVRNHFISLSTFTEYES